MKRNISINISGIIFHVEEDGYEQLHQYLDSIHTYFSSFKDSNEILADIESRIAELFLAKLTEGKQIITLEDVNSLIAKFGNVSDFKAAEQQDVISDTNRPSNQGTSSGTSTPQKLYRDSRRKVIAGVCAGLANYFNIDSVWPRILFAILFISTFGIGLMGYLLLWILLPASDQLEDKTSFKKMYRDVDQKILGGVAGGLATYFSIDKTLVRILFILTIFLGGAGLLLYIILWFALPPANSITEKMQMQGEPVTLHNIESTIKNNLTEKEPEESTITKIILFPFRILSTILSTGSKTISPIVVLLLDMIRVVFALCIFLVGFILLVCIVVLVGIFLGYLNPSFVPEFLSVSIPETSIPLEAIKATFPIWGVLATFAIIIIPSFAIMLSGGSILAKRSLFKPTLGWSLLGLFILSVLVLSITIPNVLYSFKEEGVYKTEKIFTIKNKIPILKLHETGLDDYQTVDLEIKGYEGNTIKLVQQFKAQGYTRKDGAEQAQLVEYNVQQLDSSIVFDSNITFKKNAKFRAQRLDMELLIPFNQVFIIEKELWDLIDDYSYDFDSYESEDATVNKKWKITTDGIECVNCVEDTVKKNTKLNDPNRLTDFNEIEVSGVFDLEIRKGNEYSIRLDGQESEKSKYKLSVSQETLEIKYQSAKSRFWGKGNDMNRKIRIYITTPQLTKLKLKGAGNFELKDFDEERLKITLLGAINGVAFINSKTLALEISGPIIFQLKGDGKILQADIEKLAQLKAAQYNVKEATIEAKELAQATVNVSHSIEITKDALSLVDYKGDPEIVEQH